MGRESLTELLGELANESSALVRDEIELAKQEMNERIVGLKAGAVLTAAGSGVALLGLLSLTATAVIALAQVVGFLYSALIIGVALLVIGGIVISLGVSRLKQTSLRPEQTIETMRENKEWLKELT
jgi:hypothetical protein